MINYILTLIRISFIACFTLISLASQALPHHPQSEYPTDELVEHKYFALSYSEEYEQARWVSYELKADHLRLCSKRSNKYFSADPLVSTGSATADDYRNSGYTKGHLLPSGDRAFRAEAMRETFYFSNMSPQTARFNNGSWMRLEHLARAWAVSYDDLSIVTGPILRPGLQKIGPNRVSVPEAFYKIILRYNEEGKPLALAFLLPTDEPDANIQDYVVSINELEDIVGINFFEGILSEHDEDKIEVSHWDFKARKINLPCK